MNIASINCNNLHSTNYKKISASQNYNKSPASVAFTAHSEFYELDKHYNVKASSYFRRGMEYGTPSKHFQEVVNVFEDVFKGFSLKPKKVLIAGIGDSQEPFSYLTTINGIVKYKPLRLAVDMYTVDMQSMPSEYDLYVDSFYDFNGEPPMYAKKGFIRDVFNYDDGKFEHPQYYRVNGSVFYYLYNVYQNPKKSKWDTRLQDAIKTYKNEKFDVISANNIIPYIHVINKEQVILTVQNIHRVLKTGGYFITDTHDYGYLKEAELQESFEKVHPGIYKKIK